MYRDRAMGVLFGLGMFVFVGSMAASASPVSDIADGLNDALFGGANLFAAQAILTAMVMVSVGLLLAMMKLNYIGVLIVMFALLGALTAIGWADPTLIFVAGLLTAALFVKRVADYMTGRPSDSSDK